MTRLNRIVCLFAALTAFLAWLAPARASDLPPGAQPFDFAAAWGRPAVPFTSYTALLRKDYDDTIPEEQLCEEFECATWIGDALSVPDAFDAYGTFEFLELIPFPPELQSPIRQLSDFDAAFPVGLEGALEIKRFVVSGRLTTVAGFDQYVSGLVIRADLKLTDPDTLALSGVTVYFSHQWETEEDATEFVTWFANSLYRPTGTGVAVSGATSMNRAQAPARFAGFQRVQLANGTPDVLDRWNQCIELWVDDDSVCRSRLEDRVIDIEDHYEQEMARHKAAWEAAEHNVALNVGSGTGGALAGAGACAILGAKIGCVGGPVGSAIGGVTGAAVGAVIGGFTGYYGSRAAETWYETGEYRQKVAGEQAVRDTSICQAIRDYHSCHEQAYARFIECNDFDPQRMPPIPLENLVPLQIPSPCAEPMWVEPPSRSRGQTSR